MITDLTKKGIKFDRYQLQLKVPIREKVTTDSIFHKMEEPAWHEFMSPFHTGTKEEREEKRALKEEAEYVLDSTRCPYCNRLHLLRRWNPSMVCVYCSSEISLFQTVNIKRPWKEHGFNLDPDRTQAVMDILNRNF